MKHKQSGMTLTSFVIVLAVVGFFAYIGMKLFPMYMEYYAVRSAMKGLAAEAGSADMDPSKIKDSLFRRLDVSYSDNVKPEDVTLDRVDNGWRMRVAYEVRRPIVANLDIVGKFDNTQDLTTRGGE
ncbi:DUF4845 domain-containing protein [Xanthomonas bonasiae]|uniref:DUF4845 domain-containing protein n=1 Tax=Xanthomonas bonasiae TaxID=2810351 RepID=UPI00178309DD|nr:DUF4845 domain-containing protein [Xanthomonas surreyensis]MBD7921696.1 DUF4845 domain-containing protein [Xanthomonas surreyensis]